MQQPNYTPDFESTGFKPFQAPDLTKGMAENRAAQRNSQNAIIQQMIADKSTMAANDRQAAAGMQALAKFSQTLTGEVIKAAERKADDEFTEGLLYAYDNRKSLQDDGVEDELKDEGQQITDAASKTRTEDSDVVVPAVRGSRFFQMGVNQGRTMVSLQTDYLPFMENAVKNADPKSTQELAVVLANARKEFFKRADIDRSSLSNGFLVNKLFPTLTKLDAGLNNKFKNQLAQESSFNTRTEAWAKFSNDNDVSSYLSVTRNTVDDDNERLGYSGAWNVFVKQLAQGIAGGSISESDIEDMERQPIPGDPKGRTYGDLHDDKFRKARIAAKNAEIDNWNLSRAARKMKEQQEEETLVQSFLDPNDVDGYTDEQIQQAGDQFELQYGYRSKRIDDLLNTTVEGKARVKQEEQIQDLISLNLLTPERLSKFDRRLQAKYMSTAQQQAKLSSANNKYKDQLDNISAAVKNGPNDEMAAVPVGKSHYSVGIMENRMHQYFLRKVQQYSITDPRNAATLAQEDTINYFKANAKVSKNGYVGVLRDSASIQADRIRSDARIADINDAMKEENFLEPDASPNLFTKPELEAMGANYGKPGWSTTADINYIAQIQGMDPIAVLNRFRAQQGLEELPSTPASEVVANEMTTAQRAALNNIGRTPGNEAVSNRTMGSMGYREELVPKNFGPMVSKAATSAGVPPAHIAAMAEIESGWNTNAPSYNKTSYGLMQINRASHPLFFQQNDWKDPQANLNYGAKYYGSLLEIYKDPVKAAMAYNAGPGFYDEYVRTGRIASAGEDEQVVLDQMLNHGKKFSKALYKYGGGSETLNSRENLRPALAYITGNIGPTSTGPHLDVKQVGRGEFAPTALDQFVEVDDPELGRVPLSKVPVTGDFASHTRRGSHGIDFGTYSGTKVYVKGGAKVVNTAPSEHGDVVTIQLPNGQQYTFLHGTKAN